MRVDNIKNLCIPGIYVLINERDKKVYISYSANIIGSISRIFASKDIETKSLRNDYKLLRLKLLSDEKDRGIQKLFAINYIKEYKDRGYSLYKEYNYVRYKVITEIERVVPSSIKSSRIFVYLAITNGKRYVVGVFQNIDEANEFVSLYYKDKEVRNIVIAKNDITKEIYSDYSYRKRYFLF